MKRIFTYILIMASALFAAVSCSNEALENDPKAPQGELKAFTLRLSTLDPAETKALTGNEIPGEDARNENTIHHVDYFFFGDEGGAQLLYHDRFPLSALTDKGNYTYEKEFDITNDYPNIKYGCYAYVVANYPHEITATTLSDIMALPLTADWTQAQTAFVMDTYDAANGSAVHVLTPKTTAEVKTITLPLTRVAAKIQVNLKVAKSYTDNANNLWKPTIDQFTHQLVRSRKSATLAGTPAAYVAASEAADYLNYASERHVTLNANVTVGGKEYYSYTLDPYYTYPQTFDTEGNTAPYIKFQMQWVNEDKGSNNFYYKFLMPELTSFDRNRIYIYDAVIDMIGGTEDDWAEVKDYYIYVADWWSPGAITATYESGQYLSVINHSYTIYGENKITIPVISSDDIEVSIVSSSQQYVSETKGTSATKAVTGASVQANGKDSFTLTHNLNTTITTTTNRAFDCTPITFVVEVKHKEGGLTKTERVTITQYPSIYASLKVGGNSFINGYYSVQSASVTPKPSTEQRAGNNQYYRVANNGNGQTISGGGYTGANINGNNYGYMNSNYDYAGKDMTLITVTAFPSGSDSYTVASSTGNAAPVESTFKYIIGDPREPSGYTSASLFPYLWGDETLAWDEGNASKIMVGTRSGKKNIIAPAFLVSSGIAGRPGNVSGMNSYDKAEKRCATYQEQGYPAGRWRLPTEAETYFMYSLQRMEVIEQLFSPGSGYYTTSGNIFGWNAGTGGYANTYTFQPAGNAEHSVRCIYDIWYWGDIATGDLHTYNPGISKIRKG